MSFLKHHVLFCVLRREVGRCPEISHCSDRARFGREPMLLADILSSVSGAGSVAANMLAP